ncbi:MAG: class I SAM-dependent methyltransferase [Bacteroidota bacterium]
MDRRQHWDNIYNTKSLNEVSWYEPIPVTSLKFVADYNIPLDAKIIDVGGGDSFLADYLLEMGYKDITVLDISAAALERAKLRLGNKAGQIKWIVADAADFQPVEQYDFWHDRAAFHFLTEEDEIAQYLMTVQKSLSAKGILVIGTFSEMGPKKCSGIDIRQYSESTMTTMLKRFFEKIKCLTFDHHTPFNTIQNFIFCSFKQLPPLHSN